ncbi:MAG: hypothetical protein H5T86_05985 [Armatimonadetes bacterium]|nr:hypothetical protein [Armatimonadota bacterium]
MMAGPPGMGPEGMMGMPGMGGAAGGQAWQWTETEMPEERCITYDEFLAQRNLTRAKIPDIFLKDEQGKAIKRTPNSWWELHRIYSEGPPPRPGTPGRRVVSVAQREYESKQSELVAVAKLYVKGLNLFRAAITGAVLPRPQDVPSDRLRPMAAARTYFGVLVWPSPAATRAYAAEVASTFSRLSQAGWFGTDRTPVWVTTYKSGPWGRKAYWLWSEAANLWRQLWASTQVRVRLFTTDGMVVADAITPLGVNTDDVTFWLLNPPELPHLFGPELTVGRAVLTTFKGGRMPAISNAWPFALSFTAESEIVRRLDAAEVVIQGGIAAPPPSGRLVLVREADPVKVLERHQNVYATICRHGRVEAQGVYTPLQAQLVPFATILAEIAGPGAAAARAAGQAGFGAPGAAGPVEGGMGLGAPGMAGGGLPPGVPGPGQMGPVGPGYQLSLPPTAGMLPL